MSQPIEHAVVAAGAEQRFEDVDDDLHEAGDDFYFNETVWFSFFVPERAIGGWLYSGVRPNLNASAGGCWIWDASATEPWRIPFYERFAHLKMPTTSGATMVWPNGNVNTTVTPGMVYDLEYTDRDRLHLQLRFTGHEEPVPLLAGAPPYPKASHFDQTGRVTGQFTLDGDRFDVDCHAMRDRSWGTRKERGFRPVGYTWLANDEISLLVYSHPAENGDDAIHTGYVRRGSNVSRVQSGRREVRRDPSNGWVTEMTMTVVDSAGEQVSIIGTALSRMVLLGSTNVCVNSVMTWQVDGVQLWGEDQDVWPLPRWRVLAGGGRSRR